MHLKHFEGSLTSNDSGHGSYIPSSSGSGAVGDFHSDNFNGSGSNGGGGGLYQVACSIVHNSPSPITNDRFHPQRRHSAISHVYNPGMFILRENDGDGKHTHTYKKARQERVTNKQK